MTEQERLLKNKQISRTKNETIERHSKMSIKTFDVKIQWNKLSNRQKEEITKVFLEQKWYKNYVLNWAETSGNKISKFDTKITEITHKDKDLNDIPYKIKYLTSQSRQCLLSRMCSNIKTLHTLKINGVQKSGKLKYSKEETSIDLKQYGVSHRIVSPKRIKIAGIHKSVIVNGLDQILGLGKVEFTNARLIHRPTGYFVQLVVYVPKETKQTNGKTIGIDFGCSISFTTSEGEKINVKIQESERLKRLQKKLSKKTKHSKNFNKTVKLIKKEYQKQTNKKNDIANKIVANFSEYEKIVIQDEQLNNWKKNKHGKAVQHSVLGRVKQKLVIKDNVIVLDKYFPTTKLCTNCGMYHDELKLSNRQFICDCGVNEDRDIHAAKNMVWFYKNEVGVGRTNFKPVEKKASALNLDSRKSYTSVKQEASVL